MGAAIALWGGAPQALAQSNTLRIQPTFDTSATAYQVQLARPNVNQDGVFLTCSYGTDNCLTFNRSMCEDSRQNVPIQLSIFRGQGPIGQTANNSQVRAYAWLQGSNSVCSTDPAFIQNGNTVWPLDAQKRVPSTDTLPTSYSVVSATGSAALIVPDRFINGWPTNATDSSGTPLLTVGDIMHAFPQACDPNGPGVAYSRWRICMGVDFTGTGYINLAAQAGSGTANAQTPVGFMEFLISTVTPDAPEVDTPLPLFGRVRFSVTYDNAQQNLLQVRVDKRAVDAPNQPGIDCNNLAAFDKGQPVGIGPNIGTGSVNVDVPGENGTTYAYCISTIDVVGTTSLPAGPFFAAPEFQSGVFGVWDALHPGFGSCQAAPLALPAGALGCALLVRARRRRRTVTGAPPG